MTTATTATTGTTAATARRGHVSHDVQAPVGGPLLTRPMLVLLAVTAFGMAVIVYRLIFGIGAIAVLNDGYTWGPWKTVSIIVLTAFASGGYAVALLVYVFNKEQFHGLARTAILTSAVGYTAGVVTLGFDIGKPWNFWRLILVNHWNLHSVLLEVAVCISIYIVFLWLEMAPPLFDGWKQGGAGPLRRFAMTWTAPLERALPYIVAMAIVLPSMHQSSLGSLMMLAGPRLHPYWQTPLLPLLFLISCWLLGYAFVIVASMASSLAWDRPLEMRGLAGIAQVTSWLVFVFAVVRLADLLARGQFVVVPFSGFSLLVLVEFALMLGPALMLHNATAQVVPQRLFLGAMAILGGGGLYRLDTALIGFLPGENFSYFPSVLEMSVSIGFTALAIATYIYIVKRFPILPAPQAHGSAA